MSTKLWMVAAIVATSSLLFDTSQANAQGRHPCGNAGNGYAQTTQYMNYPASRGYITVSPGYQVENYRSYPTYSAGYGSFNGYGYGYPNQYRYQSGYRGYNYPTRSGLNVGIGVGGFANPGYRGFGY
ncbi:hypothetical protein [Neorhodopirellula pilleata]|uniref:Uncharacterized protein n=1 Tax=Neorhodopirellula pilleata TaxID=2714738 RepID=A0A5C6AH84_9BACT|nr:hypothetical protein [Neorhodopirellula pilleata]TWT98776.1 hypothetical protein Pla100_19420 [Neorhodopirellula pilleata]